MWHNTIGQVPWGFSEIQASKQFPKFSFQANCDWLCRGGGHQLTTRALWLLTLALRLWTCHTSLSPLSFWKRRRWRWRNWMAIESPWESWLMVILWLKKRLVRIWEKSGGHRNYNTWKHLRRTWDIVFMKSLIKYIQRIIHMVHALLCFVVDCLIVTIWFLTKNALKWDYFLRSHLQQIWLLSTWDKQFF